MTPSNPTLKDKKHKVIAGESYNCFYESDVKHHIDRLQKRLKELKCYCELCAFGETCNKNEKLVRVEDVIKCFKEEINL